MNRDQYATYNISREGQFTVPTTVTVNIQGVDTGITGTQSFTVNDIPKSLKGVVNNVIATMPAGVNNGAENFDTIEVAFNKRFARGFFLDSSYDYTRSDALVGNAGSTSPLTQSDPISTGRYFQNVYPDRREPSVAHQLGVPPVEPVRFPA